MSEPASFELIDYFAPAERPMNEGEVETPDAWRTLRCLCLDILRRAAAKRGLEDWAGVVTSAKCDGKFMRMTMQLAVPLSDPPAQTLVRCLEQTRVRYLESGEAT